MLGNRWWCNPSCIAMCITSQQAKTWNTIWIKQRDARQNLNVFNFKVFTLEGVFQKLCFSYLKCNLCGDESLKNTRLLTESVLMNTYSSIPCQYQSPHFWTAASDHRSQSLHLQVAQMFSSTRWNDCVTLLNKPQEIFYSIAFLSQRWHHLKYLLNRHRVHLL